MKEVSLPYVNEFLDRHGNVQSYFRRRGQRIPLPGSPGSPEYLSVYQAALEGAFVPVSKKGSSISPLSIEAVVKRFYESLQFKSSRPNTQRAYRLYLGRLCRDCGNLPAPELELVHVEHLLSKLADKPFACRRYLECLRTLMDFAVRQKIRPDNPIRDYKMPPPPKTEGFATWTEAHIAKYEAYYPSGTLERLAEVIALYLAMRREDLIAFGPRHVVDGVVYFIPQKTARSSGIDLAIPIHPALAREIATAPEDQDTFLLMRVNRKPFSPDHFTAWFARACRRAGLPKGLSVHGLRKAACRRLAEAGCTPHQIMAVSGHTTLKEVERYTRKAERKRMAVTALGTIERSFGTEQTEVTNFDPEVAN